VRQIAIFAVAVGLLLAPSRRGSAQPLENEADALLALQRAGALVTFEKGGGTRVSLSGIKAVARLLDQVKVLSGVESLELVGTDVNDKSLGKISALTKLRSLNLASTRVGDEGLKHLGGLTNLADLSLLGTQVSDKGLGHLKTLTELRTLVVKATRVTSEGAGKLRESLPKVAVIGVREWETGYIRVEMEGTLLREVRDKKERWSIKVRTALAGEITWLLEFPPGNEIRQTAQPLATKTVVVTGEIVREPHFPGIGGESYLVPPPEPKVLVRTLRAAEEE
jgi:hypothetical protein